MPQPEGTPLARFAQALAHDDGMTFGSPRLSADGSMALLPILQAASRPRRYLLPAEARETLSATDPGRIDRLRVRNDAGMPVFLPPGTLFRGEGTASRGTTAGVVLAPHSESDVGVCCVHRSQPVVAGVPLHLAPAAAPPRVCAALIARDQARVWASVTELLAGTPSAVSDDLVATLGAGGGVPPSGTSTDAHETGAVFLDTDGVAAVEWFDSPESWRISTESAPDRWSAQSRRTADSPWTRSLDSAAAVRMAKEFLADLGAADLHAVAASSWAGADPLLGCTAMGDALAHLVAFGGDWASPPAASAPALVPAPSSLVASEDSTWSASAASAALGRDDAEVVSADAVVDVEPQDAPAPAASVRPRRRKVLTSGWDGPTFAALEHYAHKEFRGDRSAALRYLVRGGLRARGYLGLTPQRSPSLPASPAPEAAPPSAELARAGLEARITDLERIAETPEYAVWLRKRARMELERMASTLEDDLLRVTAQTALDGLSPVESTVEPEPGPPEPIEEETPPPSPPPTRVDARALLRQAFAASAGGDYRESLTIFDRILAADPADRTARLGRAVAYRRAGKTQEALADLELVLGVEPRNAAALLAKGRILQGQGDLGGALGAFDLLVDVAGNDWDVWMARGDVLAKMGRNEDALRSYGEALRRNPEDQDLQSRMRTLEKARPAPAPMTFPRPTPPPGVEEGQSYLITEARHDRSYALFRALAGQKVPSLVVTSHSRDLVRKEIGVVGVRIVGLDYAPGEDVHHPTALASLARTVERFVEDNQGRGVILLDGMDDLVAGNGFRDTLLFLEHLNDAIVQSQAVLLVAVAPDMLPDRERALLERSVRPLD